MHTGEDNNKRLEGIIHALIEYSKGNFDVRQEISEEDDALNTVASGLNMLGEELQHYHQQVEDGKNFLQNILSSIDEVVYARRVIHDNPPKSPFTFISARCKEILGFTIDELKVQPDRWIQSVHPEDAIHISAIIRSVLEGNEETFTYRIFHGVKNEYRWIEDRLVSEKDESGKVIQIFGTARDVTEQRKTDSELRDKNELVSRIVATSDQFFYVVTLDSKNSFINNFTYHSWQIEDIQGSTPEDLNNNPLGWLKAIHPDDMSDVVEQNRIMFSNHKPVVRVYRVKNKKTRKYVWIEDHVVPVPDSKGNIHELYGSVRDITSRMKTELDKEKLIKELSNKVNETMQFNYIVSHNLRAPVANIIGLVKLLDINMPEEDLRNTIGYISEAAMSMDELLSDLNTILSARSNLNKKVEMFLLTDVVRTVSNNLRKEIETANATIKTDIAHSANELSSIKSYIQSTMFNLLSNAIKYRDEERPLQINITAKKADGNTVIRVADNGIGIDMKEHGDRIFGLYSRIHYSYEGKGLGLYMTKTQLESVGGSISVSSTFGKGTIFTVTLPQFVLS